MYPFPAIKRADLSGPVRPSGPIAHRRRGIENLTGKRQLAPQMQKGQGTCSRMTGSCRCDDPCATMILEVVEAGTFVKRKKDKAEQLRKSNTLMMTCT